MKKILLVWLAVCMLLVGCTQQTVEQGTSELDEKEIVQEENIKEEVSDVVVEPETQETPEVVEEKNEEIIAQEETIILPMKSGIDIENIEDAIINVAFDINAFDFENKTLAVELFEMDIYDAVDIFNMKVGDIIVVQDEKFPVESIKTENGFIDINDGYTYSEFGMTFMSNEGGTYRTILLDDYATYSKMGGRTIKLADELKLIDYTDGDYGNEGVTVEFDGLEDFLLGLDEGHNCFGYQNTQARIVDNQIVEIVRHWVP